MGVITAIILMGLLSFVVADPPSQQDYGLCSQIYIMHQYCTSQLSPTSIALSQRPVRQPRTGKAGPRGPRGIVNYTAIDEKLAGKFSEWEAKMEEKFMTFKSSAGKEVKEMKLAAENMTKGYGADMQENFTRLMISAELKMDKMTANFTNEENDLKESIEGKFRRWKTQADSEMREMKSGIASKTNEWQRLKDELAEQKASLHSEMMMMKAGIANKTREYEESMRENFTRWGNSAELEVQEIKANLTKKENDLKQMKDELLELKTSLNLEIRKMKFEIANETKESEASMRQNCTNWKNSTESVIREIKANLSNKENEVRSTATPLLPASCEEAGTSSGVVNIQRGGKIYEVYCDMSTDGGNWMVFQRRVDGSVDFYRNWEEYASGFGNKNEEFWLGLETIHQLTQDGEYELRVDLTDWDGSTAYAKYRTFSLGDRSDGYRLTVGGYSGTAGDSMRYHNGRPFSAKDKDLDGYNCATDIHAAWWFNGCAESSLNGRYNGTSDYRSGVLWFHWGNRWNYSLKSSEMKFRKK